MSRKQKSLISSSHIKRKSEDDDLVIVKPITMKIVMVDSESKYA